MRISIIALTIFVSSSVSYSDEEYPPGLFENSPVINQHNYHKSKKEHRKHEKDNGCHHYENWNYPYPQPC